MSDGKTAQIDTLSWPEQYRELATQTKDPRLKTFYGAGCVAPETPLSDVPFVAVDFETTGLDPDSHSIVSIGVVPFTLDRVQLGGSRHWLVKPQLPLHQTSITIHGITHADIDKAPDLADVLDEFLESMAGRVPVVHYRNIERPFLNMALKWRIGEDIRFPVMDTMAIEAYLHPNRKRSWWQKLKGQQPISIRLADSRRRYGLPHYPPHNALVDALASAELLMAQVQHHFSPETPIGDLWL
ncbi:MULTISPECIES: 3'-5' exonuclease [Marinobacter]|jgi:DNA polymerase-3 subunit epsilon|uniref:3'-5' exonuclease n=1 Tax=Marinobacter TaxID=2742 RepID=UPI00094919CA|nr:MULTISPECIES: 3'-5' exonuclease [Marinobacter]MCZ4284449.1 3'-5' exonuclease [Marinobacter salarius]MDM8180735.1 3'-5' exonuclease [Marinobacter salarius]OLF84087.1 DNA polymerase III subunit epsilon [Marinobacter sp. C18]RUT77300.1 3'-5' exonuclease [Marinobacter sp. NP-6]VVT17301.1 DNA polymerase III subunit epsilon [Marinobacter salarius]|tara:strand:+ start:3308 stop:4030 length:723 start_codon:yes stop_codon:yes gene_type:complete